jgi:hypothetical protein
MMPANPIVAGRHHNTDKGMDAMLSTKMKVKHCSTFILANESE